MTVAAAPAVMQAGWLRGRNFDLGFIVGIALLALASGWLVVRDPRLFAPILLLDLWLLGYHHVVATYTRLCFDRESFRANRVFLFWLPPFILAGVVLMILGFGAWSVATLYLYWQWFHYTRQSYGVGQAYRRKAGSLVVESEWFAKAAFYLLPIWGILHRSHQAPELFLGMELRVIPVPALAVEIVGYCALAGVAWWLAGRIIAWWHGRLPAAHTLYVLSHFTVFFVGYILIEDINFGWLVINIWHNAQYVLFVWLFNSNRFKSGIDPKAKLLSTLSQPNNAWRYFLVCFGISTTVYLGLDASLSWFESMALPLVLIVYQAINFHHYIVDAVIWRRRRVQVSLARAT